jgi:hypothetical protein
MEPVPPRNTSYRHHLLTHSIHDSESYTCGKLDESPNTAEA